MESIFIFIQHIVPQQLLSRCTGWLARLRRPVWLKNRAIGAFVRHFRVDMSEAEEPDVRAYPCFNAFFTRALKEGARPIAPADVVCPADGTVSQLGTISEGLIFQAKGRYYSTEALLGGDAARAARFVRGMFATIYLSPRDYHRVHMPLDGTLTATTYVPGRLFSVNPTTADNVDRLFARNERLVCHFDTPAGPMAMILVGAIIVAGIETVWSGQEAPPPRRIAHRDYLATPVNVELDRGEEMGRFKLGSTVILLFPQGSVRWDPQYAPLVSTRLGEKLGDLV